MIMARKPRILLVPDIAWWVIGEMGKQIVARYKDKYDFYFMPAPVLERRPDLLREAISAVDAIHCIDDDSALGLFRDFDTQSLPPIATWIHHVTTWAPHHQLAAEKSAALITCTQEWKEFVNEHVGGRIPITVVPHGVDTEFFSPRGISPGRFGIPAGKFIVGFLGNKESDLDRGRKGTGVMLDVIRQAALQLPNLHVVIGGPGWETEVVKLRATGISVSATGYIRKSDLPALYSALDVYLLTSRVEGGPCTVFEAMACETAVVSTRVGVVPELIVDGVNGISVAVDDRAALVQAIVELGQSSERKTALAKAGRTTISARQWATALSPLEGVYDDLIQRGRKNGVAQTAPVWMNDPDGLLRACCAADALLTVYTRVRRRSLPVGKGLRMLQEMLSDLSMIDIVKGALMLKRRKA
jgi:glycosyltransferase involved in cell wall biosynthesis